MIDGRPVAEEVPETRPRPALREGVAALALTAALAFAIVFAEWLFLVTMPSFLRSLAPVLRFEALFVGGLALLGAALAVALAAAIAALAIGFAGGRGGRLVLAIGPAAALVVLLVVLIDNFTRTLLSFGFGDGGAAGRVAGIAVVALLAVWAMRRTRAAIARLAALAASTLVVLTLLAAAPGALGLTLWAAAVAGAGPDLVGRLVAAAPPGPLPNILVFAADGVTADHVSAYGYPRPTTPALDRLLAESLVAENAFTNSARTTGALTALMTGRHATTTKVLYPPHILLGEDAYLQLPRLLRQLGYRAVQETARYYADGPELNWRDSFDSANRRVTATRPPAPDVGRELALQAPREFHRVLTDRLHRRFAGLVTAAPQVDPFAALISKEDARVYGFSDEDRVARVREFIAAGDGRPFFAHLHLMETHCCAFRPDKPYFSAAPGLAEQELAMARFDDTIRESDLLFGELLDFLRDRGELERTIVVYFSDHSHHWDFRGRVPLVIRFPGGAHAGRLRHDVQLLDIAPTLLDALGIPVPEWMEGDSLLAGEPPPLRPIFSTTELLRSHFRTTNDESLAQLVGAGPPRYGLRQMGMAVCNAWYLFDLASGTTEWGPIPGHTAPCAFDSLPTPDAATGAIREHLVSRGFEVPPPPS
jgi:arylsulfatase A-like enzyme